MAEKEYNQINFYDIEYSHRINPIQKRYIRTLDDAIEAASLLIDLLFGKYYAETIEDVYCRKSAENFLAACIYFICNYEVTPYDRQWNELVEVEQIDPDKGYTGCSYLDKDGKPAEFHHYNGCYADLPHVLAFIMNDDYCNIFDTLMTDEIVYPLIKPLRDSLVQRGFKHLERILGPLRIYAARLMTPEFFWVLSSDNIEFDATGAGKTPQLLLFKKDSDWGGVNALNMLITHILHKETGIHKVKDTTVRMNYVETDKDRFIKQYDFIDDKEKRRTLMENYHRIINETEEMIDNVLDLDEDMLFNLANKQDEENDRPFTEEEIAELFKDDDDNESRILGSEILQKLAEDDSLFNFTDKKGKNHPNGTSH